MVADEVNFHCCTTAVHSLWCFAIMLDLFWMQLDSRVLHIHGCIIMNSEAQTRGPQLEEQDINNNNNTIAWKGLTSLCSRWTLQSSNNLCQFWCYVNRESLSSSFHRVKSWSQTWVKSGLSHWSKTINSLPLTAACFGCLFFIPSASPLAGWAEMYILSNFSPTWVFFWAHTQCYV